ncbi:hypothetical protein SUDANB105_00043 [Streptomyces sp. enrichment culture]
MPTAIVSVATSPNERTSSPGALREDELLPRKRLRLAPSGGAALTAEMPSICLSSDRASTVRRCSGPKDGRQAWLDGTHAECDRVGDSRADFSHKHRRHGVNVQVVADPEGKLLWISPALF